MSAAWNKFRGFWLAEEIPRWIGLLLVALFVAGPMAVALISIWDADQEHFQDQRRACEQSTLLLADTLTGQVDPGMISRRLRSFGQSFACQQLRVVSADGVITDSINQMEVGQSQSLVSGARSQPPTQLESYAVASTAPGQPSVWLIRAPIPDPSSQAPRYLELIMGAAHSGPFWSRTPFWALTVILISVGVLLFLYRRLQQHLRAVTRIGDNLVSHSIELESDLAALRISDSLGTVARAWNQLLDLTEQFQESAVRSDASSELKRVLEKAGGGELADALNVLPDGVIVVTSDERISFVNTVATSLLGRDADQIVGIGLDALETSPIGAKIVAVGRSANGERGFASLTEPINDESDGSHYRVRVLPMEGARQAGSCVLLIRDVSQQLRADRAREEFVSQITHELRTPLTNIRAYAETLASGLFDDPKVITECYNVITKETRRLGRLVEDILNISQLEAGSMQILIDDVDMMALLTEAVGDVRGLAEEKQINLQLTLPPKLPPFSGDRDKLMVVVNNLLGNALKYTPNGGEVLVACKTSDDGLLLTVKDTGIGIDPSDHERIFEKFQRSDDPEVQQQTGTGIGLTTAREIVRRHGGQIEVMSAKGSGTTFVVTLPLAGVGSTATKTPE